MNMQIDKYGNKQLGIHTSKLLKSVNNQISITDKLLSLINDEKIPVFSLYTDPKDGKRYKVVKIENWVWLADNLNRKDSSGKWRYDDDAVNCCIDGQSFDIYSYDELPSCPKGFHFYNQYERLSFIHCLKSCIDPTDWFLSAGPILVYGDLKYLKRDKLIFKNMFEFDISFVSDNNSWTEEEFYRGKY